MTATARRTKVAANLLSTNPLPLAELAPALGVSVGHASNLLRDPETRAIAGSLLEPHRQRIAELLPRALDRVAAALDATVAGIPEAQGGRVDHLMRLRATDRLRKMVELVDLYDRKAPGSDQPDGVLRGTLEELLVRYRAVTVEGSAD